MNYTGLSNLEKNLAWKTLKKSCEGFFLSRAPGYRSSCAFHFPVDTRRHFNVDTTSQRCWSDVVCLQVLWKLELYFVYIFIADLNFFTKVCSFDPSFNRNILTSLYLKSETSTHAQLHSYSFFHTIFMWIGSIDNVMNVVCNFLLEMSIFTPATSHNNDIWKQQIR